MNNLTNKPPLGLKKGKAKKSKAHLDKVRGLPCVICQTFNEPQMSPTSAHHCIHDRFGSNKVSDFDVIPLCEGHHQGLWDQSKLAIHNDKRAWRDKYGPDWSFIVPSE